MNLHQAVFDDVNLAGVTIRNANLQDASIESANIRGLTISGIRVDALVEAELDRRDPEQASLRMDDRYEPGSVRTVIARLREVRSTFYQLLRSTDTEGLVSRPSPVKWSAICRARFASLVHRRIDPETPL